MTVFDDIPSFVGLAKHCVSMAYSRVRMHETRAHRVMRRFSMAETAEIIGCTRHSLYNLLKHPDAPAGETQGREKTFSVKEIMKIRAIGASRDRSRSVILPWRKNNQKLPVITFSSLKGGTGKSLSAAHFAQHAALYHGLRVGIVDCDPQSTCSLYFVDNDTSIIDDSVDTFTDFMGVPDPGALRRVRHDTMRLNSFWKPTPWPGIRLIPGGSKIQEADIALFFLSQSSDPDAKTFYRMLRDNIHKWSEAYPPKTQPSDLVKEDGRFDDEAWELALNETFDLIVLDTAPSLSLAQVNAVMAADTLVIPQTMRGFDLSTLHTYLSSLEDYYKFVRHQANPIPFSPTGSVVLPTMVNTANQTDLRAVGELYAQNQDFISPVFYKNLPGAANAFEKYQSVYEYIPENKHQKAGIQNFLDNANAVSEHILLRAVDGIPIKGFADAFISKQFPDGEIPKWADNEGRAEVKVKESAA
jgi:chromosome partitioning protein